LNLEFPIRKEGLPTNPNRLLRRVAQRVQEAGGVENMEVRELAYLRYQADRMLVSRAWFEIPFGRRNVGVKLVGCLHYEEHLPLLLGILLDRHAVSGFQRLCGGDFQHGGLLRRNVIETGILPLGKGNDEVKEALLLALEDPYFEVRAAAARTLGELFAPDEEIETALGKALRDSAPGVVVQAIRALGAIALEAPILDWLRPFYLHSNWQFRQEVAGVLKQLVAREVLAVDQAVDQLEQILATSPFFRPEFPLNERLRELAALKPQDPEGR